MHIDKPIVVLLSAGMSKRMEGENKLLKLYKGHSLLFYSLSNALNFSDVIIVTGYQADLVKKEAKNIFHQSPSTSNLTVIYNPLYETGQLSSIISALQYLDTNNIDRDFAVIPSDLPFVTSTDYKNIYSQIKDYDIARPYCKKTPCHPVFFKAKCKNFILKEYKNYNSLSQLIKENKHNFKINNFEYSQNNKLPIDFDYRKDFLK